MEDFSIRAIVIGVSLFVTMLTLTAILMYFNTARGIADEVNKRTDIASSYDYIMNPDTYEDELTGVEVRSLINKYVAKKDIEINVEFIDGTKINNVNNRSVSSDEDSGWLIVENDMAKIISEEKLDLINPVHNFTVNKVDKSNKITLEIKQIVEE